MVQYLITTNLIWVSIPSTLCDTIYLRLHSQVQLHLFNLGTNPGMQLFVAQVLIEQLGLHGGLTWCKKLEN